MDIALNKKNGQTGYQLMAGFASALPGPKPPVPEIPPVDPAPQPASPDDPEPAPSPVIS